MIELDRINHNILNILEKDGRISNSDLSQKVGLSASACLRRVQELERSGIITGYRAQLNREALGSSITIFVMVGLSEHASSYATDFENAVSESKYVREVHNVTGSVEYLLRVEVNDLNAYKQFHSQVLGKQPQVHSITSYICLGSPKDERA